MLKCSPDEDEGGAAPATEEPKTNTETPAESPLENPAPSGPAGDGNE